jgi:hypothetical protein
MSGMPALVTRYRRPLTVALFVVASLALALVAVALWSQWRLTALYPLATTSGAIATLTMAGALLAAAGVLTMASRGRGGIVTVLIGLVAVPAFCVGLPAVVLDGTFRDRTILGTQVLATSPEGDYSIVALTVATDAAPMTKLLLRSRDGLLSREAATPVAQCPHDPFAGEVPPEAVRFTSETTVAIPVHGESTVTVEFDRGSLEPTRTVDMCPPQPS